MSLKKQHGMHNKSKLLDNILKKIKLRMENKDIVMFYNDVPFNLHNFVKKMTPKMTHTSDEQIINEINSMLNKNTVMYSNLLSYAEFNSNDSQSLIHINSFIKSDNVLFYTSYIYSDKNINVIDTFITVVNLLFYMSTR